VLIHVTWFNAVQRQLHNQVGGTSGASGSGSLPHHPERAPLGKKHCRFDADLACNHQQAGTTSADIACLL
jgi:hypothetical protein